VITSALEYEGGRYYIEDGGYPAFIEWLTEGMNILSFARRGMHVAERMVESRMKGRRVSNISRAVSALIDDGKSSSRTLPLCGMGDDVPDGKLSLSNDGWLENDWSVTSSKRYFEKIEKSMKELARALDAEFSGDLLLKMNRLITAHPVGGCPMGKDRTSGVVSEYGQVFDVPRLSIADGSILPGPVGPNPSLTIAAIADRAATFTLANW
jgi:cholesterol oxidase